MQKNIELLFEPIHIRIRARLLYELNPELCELLVASLPYQSIQCHALVAGEQLYHYTPIVQAVMYKAKTKEDKIKQPIGRINMSSLELLSIKYGVITEYLTSVPVAQVFDEDIESLKKVGRLVWDSVYKTKTLIGVTVHVLGDTKHIPIQGFTIPQIQSQNEKIRPFVQSVYDESQKIWLKPPKELLAIHRGRIKSGAGSYGQYFSTMVFVNGEVRQVGYNAFGGLLKAISNPKISLETAKILPQPFTEVAVGFLGYCGLETLQRFSMEALALLPEASCKEDILEMYQALCVYANRMHGWSLHYFPWIHGKNYPSQKIVKRKANRLQ